MSVVFKEEDFRARIRTAPPAPARPPASRDAALDCIRGLAIVWMMSAHVAPLSKLTALLHLPVYVSAFEWFALLSGIVLGMRAWRAHSSHEEERLLSSVRRQTFLLYRVHVPLV